MLELARALRDQMVAHALEDNPNECCGLLAGEGGRAVKLYRMTNVEHSPYRYSMDPRELYQVYREIEDRGWELLAIYHSHTHTEARPSATDVRLATWPDAFYILVSLMDRERSLSHKIRNRNGVTRLWLWRPLFRVLDAVSLASIAMFRRVAEFMGQAQSPDVRAFRILDGSITEEELRFAEA